MGKQVYLSDADIKVFELLEKLYDGDAGSGAYSAEEEEAVQKLFDKVRETN